MRAIYEKGVLWMFSCRMAMRAKLGEHERSVRVSNSSFLSALQTSLVSP